MTLPSSGTIDASGIYTEYYKSHTSQEVNMNTMGSLYSIGSNPLEFDEFYNNSWSIASLPSIEEPDEGITTSSGFKSGSTLDTNVFNWTATPSFAGYPIDAINITMTLVCHVSGFFNPGFGGSATGYCEYSLDGSTYNTVCSDSATENSSFSASATSSEFYITPSNYTLFRVRVRYEMSLEGLITSGIASIRLAPTAIGGGSVNHIRVDTARDTISLASGSYNGDNDEYSADLTFE